MKQLTVDMHGLEEEGNANGFVCLSLCLSDKVVFILIYYQGDNHCNCKLRCGFNLTSDKSIIALENHYIDSFGSDSVGSMHL